MPSAGRSAPRTRIHPFARLNVTVAKTYDPKTSMQGGGVMNKGVLRHVHTESRCANAEWIAVNRQKAIGWSVDSQLGSFVIHAVTGIVRKGILKVVRSRTDELVYAVTSEVIYDRPVIQRPKHTV